MIKRMQGNLLDADVEALVNPVNIAGVMGKGLALQFRHHYPDNYEFYRVRCQQGEVQMGKMLIFETQKQSHPYYIINFPTKRHWRDKSRLADVESGLQDLIKEVKQRKINSIAVPALGCGLGGLNWADVEPRIEAAFGQIPEVHVLLFAPQ